MDPIEEIKNKLNIVDVIGEYVKLQKAGKNWRGLCPFHRDKNPSFYVSEEKQLWHCFGCGAGGGIFDFIMKIEDITFPEALRLLADKAGVKLEKSSFKKNTEKEKIYEINKVAANFFMRNLFSNSGNEALEYLKRRGLSEETIKAFNIGFALDSWHSLENYLKEAGFPQDEIAKSGLLSEKGSKKFDRFRSRIMFPFFNLSGKIAGFSGRIFGREIEGVGKYINTPETLVFTKGDLIYGLYQARNFIKERDSVLIVEGQMDFLNAWEKDLKFCLATSGTAFTVSQLRTISRFSKNLILAFDMDEAGQKAAERIIPLALSLDFKIKILILSQGKDLAEYLGKINKKSIGKLFDNLLPVMDFYFQRALSMGDKRSLEGKEKIADFFLKKVKNLRSPIEQGFWVEKLADTLKVREEHLFSILSQVKVEKDNFWEEKEGEKKEGQNFFLPRSRWEILGEKIFSLVMIDKDRYYPILEKSLEKKDFLPENLRLAFDFLKNPRSIFDQETREKVSNYLTFLQLRNDYNFLNFGENGSDKYGGFDFEKEIEETINQLKKEFFREEIERISLELKSAEKDGKKKLIEELAKKMNQTLNEARKHEN